MLGRLPPRRKLIGRVTQCERIPGPRTNVRCTGTWIAGGSLLEGGRVVRGTIEGANRGDVGRILEVRVTGDTAYTTSLRLPIVLIAIGLVVAVLGGIQVRRAPGRREA